MRFERLIAATFLTVLSLPVLADDFIFGGRRLLATPQFQAVCLSPKNPCAMLRLASRPPRGKGSMKSNTAASFRRPPHAVIQ